MSRKSKGNVTYNDDNDGYIGMEEDVDEETEKVTVAIETSIPYNNTVKLVNKISARVRFPGKSGKFYVWEKAGAIQDVEPEDVDDLLKKRLGDKACCGSSNINYIFEIMKD